MRDTRLDRRAAWIAAWAALATMTVAYGAPLIVVVGMKPIAAELGTARSGPAAASALTYIGAAFGGIVAGWLAGRLGIRKVVLFGAAMVAAGLVLSSLGGLLPLYTGHGVLMGLFGTSCMFSPLLTYVSRWFERRRGSAVALISSGQSVAGTIWPPLLQLGIDMVGWRQTMMLYAVLVVVGVGAITLAFLHPPPEHSPQPVRAANGTGRNASTLGLPPNLLMALLMLAVFTCCVPM
ncbi:MAG TPA: MFS transporter, partial [Reyranella sp.]|nr:MFS transporter [Reyranella sp.]